MNTCGRIMCGRMVGRLTRAAGYSGVHFLKSTSAKITSASYVCMAVCLFTFINQTYSQGIANKWYFGSGAGLDFTTGNPVGTNGQVNTYEGSASICDANGALLFYTDGLTVWDHANQPMPNGTNLAGDPSSTQSALIVKKPLSNNIYYVFTVDNQGGPDGLRLTEVDMSLNNGSGDVTANKNILLQDSTTERLTAVKHCNGKDIWVITHDFGSNTFRSFLVTNAGVSMTPVLSSAGSVYGAVMLNASCVGYMKASPNGKQLAIANYGQDYFELFDFDSSTGTVSNPMQVNMNDPYGLEFSPDGTKLYVAGVFLPNIMQYDLSSANAAAIAASGTAVGTSTAPGALQLGPDGKIYIVQYMCTWIDAIGSPNNAGAACGFLSHAVALYASSGQIGLPNFTPYEFAAPSVPAVVSSSVNCLNASFSCAVQGNSAITSVTWCFGDPASGSANTCVSANPTHTFTTPGNYTVQAIVNYACSADTVYYTVNIPNCSLHVNVDGGSICPGSCFTLEASVTGGNGPFKFIWSPAIGSGPGPYTVCPLKTMTYTVTVIDVDSTVVTDTAVVFVNEAPQAAFTATCNTHESLSTEVSFCDHTQGAVAWQWTFGDNAGTSVERTPAYTYPGIGSYKASLVVTNAEGCTDTAYKMVEVAPRFTMYVPTAFTPNGDGLNDAFFPQGSNIDESDFQMSIYNRWGQLIYETDSEPWDGRMTGSQEIAQQDVYVWKIITRDTQHRRYEYTGHVNLLR